MIAKRILYIEDDPANRRLIYLMLERGGYELISAKTGQEGLLFARQQTPDLILLDINLPDMDGVAVCQLLKSDNALKHIPIITITGKTSDEDRDYLLAHGFDAFIAKPVNRPALIKMIEQFIG